MRSLKGLTDFGEATGTGIYLASAARRVHRVHALRNCFHRAFNLLDLDGSNLASLTRCFDHLIVDADLAGSPRIDPLPKRFAYLETERILVTPNSPDPVRCHMSELRSPSRLEKARSHLYHVSLPRDSVPG